MRRGLLGDVLVSSVFGAFLAGLFKYLYDEGIWLDQFIQAPNTIEEFMLIVVIIFFLVGVIVAAMRR